MSIKKYTVKTPITHNGSRYETGSAIELADDDAATLLNLKGSARIKVVVEAATPADPTPPADPVAEPAAAPADPVAEPAAAPAEPVVEPAAAPAASTGKKGKGR